MNFKKGDKVKMWYSSKNGDVLEVVEYAKPGILRVKDLKSGFVGMIAEEKVTKVYELDPLDGLDQQIQELEKSIDNSKNESGKHECIPGAVMRLPENNFKESYICKECGKSLGWNAVN